METDVRFFSKAKRSRLVFAFALICALALSASGCGDLLSGNEDEEKEELTNLLLIGALYLYASNPCNFIAPPTLASAMHAATNLAGRASITGRITTQGGAAVVAAVVIAQSSSVNHFSTLSSVNRDGTFLLSGLPTGATYKVAIESIDSDMAGRIATHVDCFQTPASFTDGWYAGNGVGLVSSQAAGTNVTLNTANQIADLGTILLNQ